MEFSLVTRSRVVKPLMGNTMRSILKKKTLRQAIRRKRPELLTAGPIILHDTQHGANGVTSLLGRYEWEPLDHPSYSPDISPCDFDLFPKPKDDMRGNRYNDLEEFESAVAARVRVLENSCLATGIDDLPKRWNSVIDHKGYLLGKLFNRLHYILTDPRI